MKANHFFKNSMKAAAIVCCGLMLSVGFTACSDSDLSSNEKPDGGHQEEEVITYDDLAYFQSSIIEVDENGNIKAQYVGEALFDDDPQHLYIGVDNYEEAETLFRRWIAPDVTLGATAPLTAQLTDTLGNAQGSVTFAKSTESGAVAEVTASADTQLKHFNKVSFLLNSAWPHNAASPVHHAKDIILARVPIDRVWLLDFLDEKDRVLKWMCIQEERNGQKPIFIAVSSSSYYTKGAVRPHSSDEFRDIVGSPCVPGLARAKGISDILKTRWEAFCATYDAQGGGKLSGDKFWIDSRHGIFNAYDDYMYLSSGAVYGYGGYPWEDEVRLPILFKIDWMSDAEVSQMLTPTNGSANHGIGEHYYNLFDNSTSSKWYSWRDNKEQPFFVEFCSNYPVTPTGYKFFTANDSQKYWGRNPTKWKLYGKYDETEEWTLIDERDTDKNPADALPADNEAEKAFTIAKPDLFQYFRLEISDSKGGDIQLSKFLFTY